MSISIRDISGDAVCSQDKGAEDKGNENEFGVKTR